MLKKEVSKFPVTGGSYIVGSRYSPVALLIIGTSERISEREWNLCKKAVEHGTAIAGICKTANLGIEKVIINTVCNPNIRYLIIAGRENAHGVGIALLSLFKYGIDPTTRRINVSEQYREKAREAYIPNLLLEAVERFRRQIVPIPAIVLEREVENYIVDTVTVGSRDFIIPLLSRDDYLKIPIIEKYLENIVLFLVHSCLQEPENKVKVELVHEYSDVFPTRLELYDPGAYPEESMIIEQASLQVESKTSIPVVAGASPYGVLQVSRTVYAWFIHAGEAYDIIKSLILRYGVKRATRHGDTREIALVITYRYMPWFKFEEENGKIRIIDFDTIPLESCSYPLKNREYIREYCEELLNGAWREPGKQHYSYGAQMRRYGYELYVFSDSLVEKYIYSKVNRDSFWRRDITPEIFREYFRDVINVDQLEEVVRGLEKNPYERCYLICFWDPFLDTAMLRAQPCFNLMQFMINPESNTLEVACYMRSHDFAQAHLANYYGLSAIARYVEYRLRKDVPDRFSDLKLGELLWVIYSCHIYM